MQAIQHNEPLSILNEVFGYAEFRGQQEEIIRTVCAGGDALVLMPTGGGKSLCYQIPALVREGMGIVVSPLIALMQDQVAALQQVGVRAYFLNSTLAPDQQRMVMEDAEQGRIDLLYVAPERLLQPSTLAGLGACKVSVIAIDEAHCVSSWGHDFRQDYLLLGQLKDAFENVPRIALTATADERTRVDIAERLALKSPHRFVDSFDRPNISYSVKIKQDGKKQLLRFLADQKGNSGIIYCLSRKSVNSTAEFLHGQGFNALPYHAGMPAEQRQANQHRFLVEDAIIMVATIAFGMGIDKPDVRFVAHMDLPKSMESYYQETGRAGRDGEPAEAWMIYGLQDVVRLSRMLEQSSAGDGHVRVERSKLDRLLGWCEVTTCRRQHLLAYFSETLAEPCGNCDICLQPPVTYNGTEAAQKSLSCVYRTGQRFGVSYVVDVLRGQANEKVKRFGHDSLSTFGIGSELSETHWKSVFRQLVVRGFLRVDHGNFGALTLTEASRSILRGEVELLLREETEKSSKRVRKVSYTLELEEEDVMDDLKALRREIAEENGVPPYVVFHDASLLEMVRVRPESLAAMLDISGVGQAKLQKYGEQFLEVLDQHR